MMPKGNLLPLTNGWMLPATWLYVLALHKYWLIVIYKYTATEADWYIFHYPWGDGLYKRHNDKIIIPKEAPSGGHLPWLLA